jgi:hypothetical protein
MALLTPALISRIICSFCTIILWQFLYLSKKPCSPSGFTDQFTLTFTFIPLDTPSLVFLIGGLGVFVGLAWTKIVDSFLFNSTLNLRPHNSINYSYSRFNHFKYEYIEQIEGKVMHVLQCILKCSCACLLAHSLTDGQNKKAALRKGLEPPLHKQNIGSTIWTMALSTIKHRNRNK